MTHHRGDGAFRVATPDGAVLAVYAWGGPADAPVVLFGHANGLAAGCYAPFLSLVAERLRVFAFDARGHGNSSTPGGPVETVFSVDRMADDVGFVTRAVAERASAARIAWCGHSLGAASALRLAALGRAPDWSALIAVEPPIFPPPTARAYGEAMEKQSRLVAGTLRRRTSWASPDTLAARLRGRGLYARFQEDMLAAHCRAILDPAADGGFALRCPPAIESAIFQHHSDADTWSRLGAIRVAVDLVGGDPATPDNDWVSSALPEMAAAIPQARLTVLPGAGHLLIAENPGWCAQFLFDRLLPRSMTDSRAGHA